MIAKAAGHEAAATAFDKSITEEKEAAEEIEGIIETVTSRYLELSKDKG